MAVITDTGTMGTPRRPPLGRESVTPKGIEGFMSALSDSVYGEARTMETEGEAGLRPQVLMAQGGNPQMSKPLTQRQAEPVAKLSRQAPTPTPVANTAPAPTETPSEPEAPPTEREGGAIPTQRDVWRSQADAAEFERRLETLQSEQQITQLRDQAGQHRTAADLFRRQGVLATDQAGLAERRQAAGETQATLLDDQAAQAKTSADEQAALERLTGKTRADLERREGQQRVYDARRQQFIAEMNQDAKRAHFEAFQASANAEMEEMRIESQREQAQMRVAAAGRGAGGPVADAQLASVQADLERKTGVIGRQIDIKRELRDIGVNIHEAERVHARAREEHAETVSEMKAVLTEETANRRAALIEAEGDLARRGLEGRAESQRIAAAMDGLESTNLRIQGAQMFLRQDAQEKAASYAEGAADITDWALDNRPAIPDYIHIGKEQDRQAALRNLGAGLGIIGGVVGLAGRIFGF